jgi:hypothetical protein
MKTLFLNGVFDITRRSLFLTTLSFFFFSFTILFLYKERTFINEEFLYFLCILFVFIFFWRIFGNLFEDLLNTRSTLIIENYISILDKKFELINSLIDSKKNLVNFVKEFFNFINHFGFKVEVYDKLLFSSFIISLIFNNLMKYNYNFIITYIKSVCFFLEYFFLYNNFFYIFQEEIFEIIKEIENI